MPAETSPGAPAPEQSAPAQPPAAGAAAGRSVRTAYKVIAAAVGLISSVTGLLFVFVPDLRPTGAPPAQSATLSELRVNADATFRQYLARIDQPLDGYAEEELSRRGALLDFRVRIEGFRGTTLLLKWELFDDPSGDEVDESRAIRITPTNEQNEATWQFWIPLPEDDGRYVAIVELIEQKEDHLLKLASLETEELRGLAAAAPGS